MVIGFSINSGNFSGLNPGVHGGDSRTGRKSKVLLWRSRIAITTLLRNPAL